MNNYTLSADAGEDFDNIYDYSLKSFGKKVARSYVESLKETLRNLAKNPNIGRDASNIKLGYYKYRYRSHVIYYSKNNDGIIIARLLHKAMHPIFNIEV